MYMWDADAQCSYPGIGKNSFSRRGVLRIGQTRKMERHYQCVAKFHCFHSLHRV